MVPVHRLALTLLAVGLMAVPPAPAEDGTFSPQVPCKSEPLCPDLIVDPIRMEQTVQFQDRTFSSTSCDVVEGHVPAPGSYRLLRWTYNTPNIGLGDLYVGNPAAHPEWFYFAPCHNHYHFREYADYRLWEPDYYAQWVALRTANPDKVPEEVFAAFPALRDGFVAGNKGGFCVIDLVDYTRVLPAQYRSCGNQGISVGWADEYHLSLDGQWVVIDGVAPGAYILEAEVNSERVYHEVDYLNNSSGVPVQIS